VRNPTRKRTHADGYDLYVWKSIDSSQDNLIHPTSPPLTDTWKAQYGGVADSVHFFT